MEARIRNDPQLRAERADAMGQGLPLDTAAGRRRRLDAAAALAGAASRTRAIAVQPRVDASAVTVTLGIEAETRITSARDQARLPVSRQDRHRPADARRGQHRRADRHAVHRDQQDRGSAVRRPHLSGGRLGPGRRHREARHRRGVGRPAADLAAGATPRRRRACSASAARPPCISGAGRCSIRRSRRCGSPTSRLAVESEAAFGLLGAAARAVMPHLQKALAEKADGRPQAVRHQCAEEDRRGDRRFPEERGRRAGGSAEITSLRLADIAFDSKTLRVIAEAEGTINVSVTQLAGL